MLNSKIGSEKKVGGESQRDGSGRTQMALPDLKMDGATGQKRRGPLEAEKMKKQILP